MTEDEFRMRLLKASDRSARVLQLARQVHVMGAALDAELRELQAEYDTLWTWYLQQLARGGDDDRGE
jgi:hypothetical protein